MSISTKHHSRHQQRQHEHAHAHAYGHEHNYEDDHEYKLKDKSKFIGHRGDANKPEEVIIKNNNLHFEIIINPKAFSAAHDIAGISDVIAESAVSTICDNEDSVAAVDAEDKVACYRNWLGLMKGNLKIQFEKNGKNLERKLNPDRSYISKEGIGSVSYTHLTLPTK